MKIAIITPYYKEDRKTLHRCHESVLAQTFRCDHIMVADGHHQEIDDWDIIHLKLPKSHGDFGDTPRAMGAMMAYSQGYDAICWLDADNWLEPNHVEEMVKTLGQEQRIVTATRNLYRPDGSFLGLCTESNGESFNDTNCYFIPREFISCSAINAYKPKSLAAIGDRVLWSTISNIPKVHCSIPTVNYTTTIAVHYLERNETPPDDAKVIACLQGESEYRVFLYKDIVK